MWLVKDNREFLAHLENLNQEHTPSSLNTINSVLSTTNMLACLDVNALYPNIKRSYLYEAIRHALTTCSDYNAEEIMGILKLIGPYAIQGKEAKVRMAR